MGSIFLFFRWQKVSGFLSATTATVRGLDLGQEYEFRVMAENSMGVSEPLMTTKAIKARHPYGGLETLHTIEVSLRTTQYIFWIPA